MIATHRQFKTGELAWIYPLYGHSLQHVPALVLIIDAEHHQVLFDERVHLWSGPWFKTKEDADVAIEKKRETMRSFDFWLAGPVMKQNNVKGFPIVYNVSKEQNEERKTS